ncbi:hypothetical protein FQR65_LT18990 [Abscondita terminalis]|nr:hypothetical protein FQR65_LT18990 [Abscondita terminalis]
MRIFDLYGPDLPVPCPPATLENVLGDVDQLSQSSDDDNIMVLMYLTNFGDLDLSMDTAEGFSSSETVESNPGSFVLTYKCGQMLRRANQSHSWLRFGRLRFSLDSGVTKFYDLFNKLVEFYST